jgi:hypothetical protein
MTPRIVKLGNGRMRHHTNPSKARVGLFRIGEQQRIKRVF